MRIHSSLTDCLDHPKMERTRMQEPGGHQKILPATVLYHKQTTDVKPQDINQGPIYDKATVPGLRCGRWLAGADTLGGLCGGMTPLKLGSGSVLGPSGTPLWTGCPVG
ncbi:hypothetical protein DSO57_1033415 [Entomophthora muscae]|uniref:Uncharacterized protein n=1 Tax=Entomophthora muscae TaxID=34485 RepID=A0ACC2TZK5_9FUNG|nr:hypothetical protein DSO57_1033415 [Entomophthora muscae]